VSWSIVISGLLAGLLGGPHCVAMCGGFVAALSGAAAPVPGGRRAVLPAAALAWRQVPHNLGRIATYTVLGATVGAAGGVALGADGWAAFQRSLFVVANLLLLALAAAIVLGRDGAAWLQRAGAALFGTAMAAARPLVHREGPAARFVVGALWGLVPCGLVYSVLSVALFAGGALEGAVVMLAFGLGTLPNLLATGWLLARARTWLGSPRVRWAGALLLAGFAALGLWRAFFGPLSELRGAFCF
jgi:sulfite exporter TauE/SafE